MVNDQRSIFNDGYGKGDDIQEGLINLAVEVIKLCEYLPITAGGRHVAGQLLRSGTSSAFNYGEAQGC